MSALKKYSFKDILSIKAGGNIKYLCRPKKVDSLIKIMDYIKRKNMKYYIIGNGTNIIASDKYYDGIIIHLISLPKYFNINDNILTVSASYNTSKLVLELLKLKINGLEFLCGIPGSIGGALYMNAGAFNGEIKDVFHSCRVLIDGKIMTLCKKDIIFDYRWSSLNKLDMVIIDVSFCVTQGIDNTILINKRLLKRKTTQPINYPNVGSCFKNTLKYKAWELIEMSNLRSHKIGGMMVSTLHANFLINYNNGSGDDFLKLINLIKHNVYIKYYIKLECEIIFLNF